MSEAKRYRMVDNGLTGHIKKTEIVEEVERQTGLSVVRRPGTDVIDYVIPDGRVEVKVQICKNFKCTYDTQLAGEGCYFKGWESPETDTSGPKKYCHLYGEMCIRAKCDRCVVPFGSSTCVIESIGSSDPLKI